MLIHFIHTICQSLCLFRSWMRFNLPQAQEENEGDDERAYRDAVSQIVDDECDLVVHWILSLEKAVHQGMRLEQVNQFRYGASALIKPRKERKKNPRLHYYFLFTLTVFFFLLRIASQIKYILLNKSQADRKTRCSQRHMSHHSPFPLKWARSWSSWSWKPMCRSPGILYTHSLQGPRKERTSAGHVYSSPERGKEKSTPPFKKKTTTTTTRKRNARFTLSWKIKHNRRRNGFISPGSKQKSAEKESNTLLGILKEY